MPSKIPLLERQTLFYLFQPHCVQIIEQIKEETYTLRYQQEQSRICIFILYYILTDTQPVPIPLEIKPSFKIFLKISAKISL